MESQPQNPEFRNNPENFHPWKYPEKSCFCNFKLIQLNNDHVKSGLFYESGGIDQIWIQQYHFHFSGYEA